MAEVSRDKCRHFVKCETTFVSKKFAKSQLPPHSRFVAADFIRQAVGKIGMAVANRRHFSAKTRRLKQRSVAVPGAFSSALRGVEGGAGNVAEIADEELGAAVFAVGGFRGAVIGVHDREESEILAGLFQGRHHLRG